ncbi:MAG: HAD family acid phosphatase [Deltaproteobacteria bacterium]|nr:HAD family acid phosphatase [Deltaproteobacteria bacterium]
MAETRLVLLVLAFWLTAPWAGCGGSGGNGSHTAADASANSDAGTDSDSDSDTDSDTDGDADSAPGSDAGDDTGSDSGSDTGTAGCEPATDATKTAVVFDIDATLTTGDSEYAKQIAIPSYDPAMRSKANALAQGYAARGYKVVYITARGVSVSLLDGTSATDATTAWLHKHGFPRLEGTVSLSPGLGASGAAATTYKTGVMQKLKGQGYVLAYAYGNSTTDIDAYQNATIENDRIFLVGSLSGQASSYGVEPIPDADAYANHVAAYLPSVPCAN